MMSLSLPVFGGNHGPIRNAVRLVNGEKTEPDRTQKVGILLFVERFRGDIEQLGLPVATASFTLTISFLLSELFRKWAMSGSSEWLANGVHLVLHQCNQRADHYGCSLLEAVRELVAQGLPAARRHDDKSIAPLHEARHDFFLLSFELVEAEKPGKSLL